jgi:hypothetical protein
LGKIHVNTNLKRSTQINYQKEERMSLYNVFLLMVIALLGIWFLAALVFFGMTTCRGCHARGVLTKISHYVVNENGGPFCNQCFLVTPDSLLWLYHRLKKTSKGYLYNERYYRIEKLVLENPESVFELLLSTELTGEDLNNFFGILAHGMVFRNIVAEGKTKPY